MVMAAPYEVRYRRGVHLPEAGLWLDARERRDFAVVSHAHGDHIARHQAVLCTAPTYRILAHRTARRRSAPRSHVVEYGEQVEVADAVVSLHSAGHVLGSAQVLVEHRSVRVLYSGDIKLRDGRTTPPLRHVEADVLVVESTFGRPQYRFPPPESVVAGIVDWCLDCVARQRIPVLLGYSLGKSQELLAHLADCGLTLCLHPAVHAVSEIYRSLGVALPPAACFDGDVGERTVIIWPPHLRGVSALRRLGAVRTAAITGWAVERDAAWHLGCDAAFPLSDHADFDDLCTYVERCRPRQVYTLFGFAEDFAHQLRRRGVHAHPLTATQQLTLAIG